MADKNQAQRAENNIWIQDNKKKNQEPMSQSEKKFIWIVFALMMVAIVVVILVNIPWGGDKAKIAKAYDSLTRDNVFETITVDELKDIAEDNGDFYVVFASPNITDVNQFMYEVNYEAKANNVEKVYYVLSQNLTTSELRSIYGLIGEQSITFPSVCKFVSSTNDSESHCCYRTDTHELTAYNGNLRTLIIELYAFDENA